MKKISKLLILFILLFSFGITSAYAAKSPTFHKWKKDISELQNAGLITYNWYIGAEGHQLCSNSTQGACRPNYKYFDLYYVQDENHYYITYSINPSKGVNDEAILNEYDNIDIIDFSDSSLSIQEKEKRINLLKKLLLFGYNPSPNNDLTPETITDIDPHNYLKMIAMQVLVNEILDGGRTNFDTVEPQWNGTYSLFYEIIFQNGGYEPSRTDTLYYYYKSYVEAARKADQANPSTAFDKSSYTLSWDTANKKYKAVVNGLGEYKDCKSTNNNIQTSVSGESVTILSSRPINNEVITCKYFRGVGASNQTNDEYFKHYQFRNNTEEYSQLIYGSGWKIFKKSFTVSTEKTNIEIKKVDTNSKDVNGAKFTLNLINNQSYSIDVVGNGPSVEFNRSGNYVISEIAPDGYGKINDFNIRINAKTHKIDGCDKEKKDSNGNVISCLNNQVLINYSNDTIELTVINAAKSFNIMNLDSENRFVYESSFEIRNSKGAVVYAFYSPSSSSASIPALDTGEYNIVQTSVRYPYRLPKNEKDRTTKIKVDNSRRLFVYDDNKKTYSASSDGLIKIINYSTKFNVHTVGHSNPLEGVQFELYNNDKTAKIKCEMASIGDYYCTDDENSTDNYVYVTNAGGNITFNSLPEGKYYLKEISTVPPYVLPTGNGVYTEVDIKIDNKGVSINGSYTNNTIVISNTPNSFNFYKRDTEGNVLTTGKYKLQKYDKEANKYVDLKLKEVENDGTYNPDTVIYKVDNKNGKIQFTLTKGMATFIDMESSTTYRIIETVAPEGYTKASTKDAAIVHIDEFGNASGLLVLIDQKIVKEDDSAYAELIVNIQTGKQRIMYAAVIVLVIGIIAGLIFYNKKK